MTLSVCMIVKNEESNIEAALSDFREFADEIIINDTGSTDKTEILTKRYQNDNVKYFKSEWKDDFSYSRNLSLAKASCDWIIWLDADDRIPEQSVKDLIKLKTAPIDRCFQFRIKNTINGLPLGAQWIQLRMFPNRSDIRFKGAIHEQIVYDCRKVGLKELSINTEIHHTGYDSEELTVNKTKRNLRLMNLSNYGQNPTEKMAIAASHYRLKDWGKGIDIYSKLFEEGKINQLSHGIKFQLPALIGRGYYRRKQFETAIEWFNLADMNNIEAAYEKAQCYECKQDFPNALKHYMRVLAMPEILIVQAQEYHYCKMHSFHLAWRIMIGLKMYKESLKILDEMHNIYPEFKMEP